MNKVVFLILTFVILIVSILVSDYTSINYLMGDYYVASQEIYENEQDQYLSDALTLDEYKEKIKKEEPLGIEDVSQLPIEIRIIQTESFLLRVLVFGMLVILIIFSTFVIKSKKIKFSVMTFDSKETILNIIKISLYLMIVITAYMNSRFYPNNFLLGWSVPFMWGISMLAIVIWALNIIVALKEIRRNKSKRKKASRY